MTAETVSPLIEKHKLINEAEAEYVEAQVKAGVPEADAVAQLKAARVGPASEREGTTPARHVPGGEGPSEPTGALTEVEPVRTEPLTVAEAEVELEAAKAVLVEAKAREKQVEDNARANAAQAQRDAQPARQGRTPSAPGVAAEEANKEVLNG